VREDWGRELRRANGGKAGEPYSHHCPSPSWGSSRYSTQAPLPLHIPYMRTEGFVRFLSGFVVEDGLRAPDY